MPSQCLRTGLALDTGAAGNMKPWREVVTPHEDVASGRYQQAEFAADLRQVHLGEGSAEYLDPREFFRRTYLTDSLKRLLTDAVRRLNGQGGDPVVQLQTNFGGGKTHTMLALYHLFSGARASSSRPSVGKRTMNSVSAQPARFIPRFLIVCMRTGQPWRTSSALAACYA